MPEMQQRRRTEQWPRFLAWSAACSSGDIAPWFVMLGYNFFIVIAGTGQGVTPRAIDFGPVRLGEAMGTLIETEAAL